MINFGRCILPIQNRLDLEWFPKTRMETRLEQTYNTSTSATAHAITETPNSRRTSHKVKRGRQYMKTLEYVSPKAQKLDPLVVRTRGSPDGLTPIPVLQIPVYM